MKKCFAFRWVNKLFALPIVACLSVSCSQDAVQEEIAPDPDPIVSMTDPQLLEYLGYDPEDATEYELYYTVGDEIVSKETLDRVRNEPQTRMQYNRDYLTPQYQRILLSNQHMFTMQMQEAVEEWNKLYSEKKSNIRFEIDNKAINSVQFIIYQKPTDNYLNLYVERPSNGAYGRFVQLDIGNIWYELTCTSQMKYLFMHILGHLAGFEHSLDYGNDIPTESLTIGFLCDPSSIMMDEKNLLKDKNFYKGFSDPDKEAIGALYPYITPEPDPEPEVPEFTLTCTPEPVQTSGKQTLRIETDYLFQAVYTYSKCPSPKYAFSVTREDNLKAEYTRTDMGNGKVKIRFTEPGIYQVTATVTNATESNTKTVSYNLTDPCPIITGPSKVELGIYYDFEVTYRDANHPKPLIDLWWDEMVLDTGRATVQRVSNNQFRIRFDEPGGFRILADVEGGNRIETGLFYVSVYYKPYYMIEKKVIGPNLPLIDPGELPSLSKPISPGFGGGIPIVRALATYENTLRFYADQACTQPIALQHDVLFDYCLCYALSNGERYWCEGEGTGIRMIVPKGETAVIFPQSKKTSVNGMGSNGKTVTTIRDPYYEIIYPENECTSVNPFD